MNHYSASHRAAHTLLAFCLASITFALALFFPQPPPAHAATLAVTTLVDIVAVDGFCSLREAITAANNNANFHECTGSGYGADTITVPVGTIVLSSTLGYLQVTDNLTISGAGLLSTWISGDNAVVVLYVNAGVTLNLSSVGIVYGHSTNAGGVSNYGTLNMNDVLFYDNSSTLAGGGISNVGTLSITSSFFLSNSVTGGVGGAIWQGSGTTTISNTHVFSNSAVSDGGAIYNNAGTVNIINSSIYSNTAQGSGVGGGIHNALTLTVTNSAIYANSALAGGAINNFAGRVTLNNSSVYSNSAPSGAGIFNDGFGSRVNINQSTISGNIASNGGGGIWNQVGTVALTDTTVYSNTAPWGGGVYHNIGDVNLTNSTFANNYASSGGGGIQSFALLTVTNSTFSGNNTAILRSNGTTTLRNAIVANSTVANCGGIITNGGNNLQYGGTVANSCGAGILTADPKLGPLASNGGATQTMALLPGSAAIDAGNDALCPATDQRGAQRPIGPHCDIGAYEAGYLFLPLILK